MTESRSWKPFSVRHEKWPALAVPITMDVPSGSSTENREIIWEDGQKYEIDRVIDIRPAYAAKAGGQGDRYTIQVNGARTYLYFERSTNLTGNTIGRWFVERKVPLRDLL